jgi:hypothetical protein
MGMRLTKYAFETLIQKERCYMQKIYTIIVVTIVYLLAVQALPRERPYDILARQLKELSSTVAEYSHGMCPRWHTRHDCSHDFDVVQSRMYHAYIVIRSAKILYREQGAEQMDDALNQARSLLRNARSQFVAHQNWYGDRVTTNAKPPP